MIHPEQKLLFKVLYFLLMFFSLMIGIASFISGVMLMIKGGAFAGGFIGGAVMLAIGCYGLYVGSNAAFKFKKIHGE